VFTGNGQRKSLSSPQISGMEQDEPFAKLKSLPIQLQHDHSQNSPLPSPVESNYPSSISSSIGELDLETGKRIRRSRSRALIAPSTSYEGSKAYAETSTIAMNVSGRLGDKGNQDEPDNPDNVMAVTNADTVDEDDPTYDTLNTLPTNDAIIQAFQGSDQPMEPSGRSTSWFISFVDSKILLTCDFHCFSNSKRIPARVILENCKRGIPSQHARYCITWS
jgi:hypothetical protein